MGAALRNSGYGCQHAEDNPPESASISSGSLVESLSIYTWVDIRILLPRISMYMNLNAPEIVQATIFSVF